MPGQNGGCSRGRKPEDPAKANEKEQPVRSEEYQESEWKPREEKVSRRNCSIFPIFK